MSPVATPLPSHPHLFKRAKISSKAPLWFCSNAKFIHLTRSAADEILPSVASCTRYLLAAHACHDLPSLAASRRFTNVHRCGSRLLLRVYFLCLVSCASLHLRQDRAVPLKHANLSCIKFRFFAVLASCRTLSCLSAASRRRLISQSHMPHIHTALVVSFSGCALKFWSKSPI